MFKSCYAPRCQNPTKAFASAALLWAKLELCARIGWAVCTNACKRTRLQSRPESWQRMATKLLLRSDSDYTLVARLDSSLLSGKTQSKTSQAICKAVSKCTAGHTTWGAQQGRQTDCARRNFHSMPAMHTSRSSSGSDSFWYATSSTKPGISSKGASPLTKLLSGSCKPAGTSDPTLTLCNHTCRSPVKRGLPSSAR